MININLYGGPGVGKSTISAGLFHRMKTDGYKVEYVSEFAKELTFSEDWTRLKDQLLILAEQHHRLFRLDGKVDYVIHDSPINMGQVYLDDNSIPVKEFKDFSNALFNRYNNINIFLVRNTDEHKYQEYGRNQTLDEAIEKDKEILKLLDDNKIPYKRVLVNSKSVNTILSLI